MIEFNKDKNNLIIYTTAKNNETGITETLCKPSSNRNLGQDLHSIMKYAKHNKEDTLIGITIEDTITNEERRIYKADRILDSFDRDVDFIFDYNDNSILQSYLTGPIVEGEVYTTLNQAGEKTKM